MSTKINLPTSFVFNTRIAIRITDLNYGNHVGNDAFLALLHEARVQYLQSIGASELNFFGTSLIMRSAAIEFKAELFYGDQVDIFIAPGEYTTSSFTLFYKLQVERGEKHINAAIAQTGMVCFNYEVRKPVALSAQALAAFA